MKEQLRTLIPPANTCLLYKTPAEWRKTVIPFIEIGLKRNEKCLCVLSGHSTPEIKAQLSRGKNGVKSPVKPGLLIFESTAKFCFQNGYFNPLQILTRLQKEMQYATEKGFTALRCVFEMPAKDVPHDIFLEYAVTLNKTLSLMQTCMILCTVNQRISPPEIVRNAILAYPNLIYNGHLYHNFYCITDLPARGLKHDKLGADYWLKNLEREKNCQERAFFLTDVMEHSVQPFFAGYPDGRIKAFNPAFCRLSGYNKNELIARKWTTTLTSKKWRKVDAEFMEKLNLTKQPQHYEKEILCKNGTSVPIELFVHQISDADGLPLYYYGFINDISERRRSENALYESAERYRNLLETAPEVIYSISKQGLLLSLNPAFEKVTGWKCSDYIGKPFMALIHPEDMETAFKTFQQVLNGEIPPTYRIRIKTKSGNYIIGEFTSTPLIENGKITGEFGIGRDATTQVQSEEALREGERFLSDIFSSIQDGISILDTDMNVIRTNTAIEHTYTHNMPLCGHKCYQVYHGKTEPCPICPSRQTIKTGKPAFEIVHKTGPGGKQTGWQELYSFPLKDSKTGKLTGVIEYVRDITERKRLEDRLQQSNKMETIGRFAGGIAHDFNNLLTAIMNHSMFVRDSLAPGSRIFDDINEVIKTTERGASLTRQLLTFSRNQPVNPQVLDINNVLADMEKMLRRLVRDNIEFSIKPSKDITTVRMDKGQLEQVIVNLVVNANDAMPDGGKLVIETENTFVKHSFDYHPVNAPQGRYVMLAVSDTGTGISQDVKEHLFEPFFTTKGKNKGTGLGLATCYGIMKQNNGEIKAYSEDGKGSTFRVYMPAFENGQSIVPEQTPAQEFSAEGTETILLVDDEPAVRNIISRVLSENGYTIISNKSASKALAFAKKPQGKNIRLLITDVVMPEMSGKELAEQVKSIRPGIKVLYISGYTNNIISHHGISNHTNEFLQKPFSATGLTQKVREVLDKKSL
ncbi:MAG: PAS domain S-box protein [Planctomycetes bacterium]|nr:PAS domain S-box protein [Planctomycetota bacterium]